MRVSTKNLAKKYHLKKREIQEELEKAFYYFCSERDLDLYLKRHIIPKTKKDVPE